jgi:putative AlgH/UPF0301 family transcriptional regulator
MDVPLGKGVVLIATPALRDPNFRQTVILLCEHGPEGALGVVLNRPTEMNITEVLYHRSAASHARARGPTTPRLLWWTGSKR